MFALRIITLRNVAIRIVHKPWRNIEFEETLFEETLFEEALAETLGAEAL